MEQQKRNTTRLMQWQKWEGDLKFLCKRGDAPGDSGFVHVYR